MSNTIPNLNFMYGTAWKEELTEECVVNAIKAGYRAIDTANQRKHYFEKGVGDALKFSYSKLGIKREELFLQTKFTYLSSQDDRLPYSKGANLKTQVEQSFQSSLEHLQTNYIDSYLLHGPNGDQELSASDWEVWQAMESFCRQGKIRYLGAANMNLQQTRSLFEKAEIKPSFIQNRSYAINKWDQEVREYCNENGIGYQGFSLLTGSWKLLGGEVQHPQSRAVPQLVLPEAENSNVHPLIQEILNDTHKNISQVVFRFAQQIGIIPITGTRSPEHMRSNLNIEDFDLNPTQIDIIKKLAFLDDAKTYLK